MGGWEVFQVSGVSFGITSRSEGNQRIELRMLLDVIWREPKAYITQSVSVAALKLRTRRNKECDKESAYVYIYIIIYVYTLYNM